MATMTNVERCSGPTIPIKRYEQVETSCVQDNRVLALSVGRQDIDRCVKVIRQYGLLTPPVVGDLAGGGQVVLSGECEFLAMREIGAKSVDAVTVPIGEKEEGDKLSLVLSSLKKSPNALSEGILINQLFKTGQYTQSQLGGMLGKSASWVNKRISLVTRLEPPVMALVKLGQLCPHSAQEISRLPAGVQHDFSVAAVREGLPKSSVEALVAAFNAPACPEEVRAQILSDPRQTLARLHDADAPAPIRRKPTKTALFPGENAGGEVGRIRRQLAAIKARLSDPEAADKMDDRLWKALRDDVASLLAVLDRRQAPSPWGGAEWGCNQHGD